MTRVHARKLDERFDAGLGATTTRADALDLVRQAFMCAGLDTPDLDARLLLMKALQIDAVAIIAWPNLPLGSAGAARLAGFVQRRLAREPVGRILGQREFWGLPFELSSETLEPRPETETIVETALSLMSDKQADLRILDLGTGSGCLLVALLHELPHAWGLGLDRSFSALTTARRNAARNGVADRAAFVMADWTAALRGRFDLVVSNPPYIASPDLPGLAPEVREHDPIAALDGGYDGLAAYRSIFAGARYLLDPRGTLIVEIGSTQEQAVRNLAVAAGLEVIRVAPDLGGHPRGIAMTPSYFEAELAFPAGTPI
jgi:release factor glutamine methyltransferase